MGNSQRRDLARVHATGEIEPLEADAVRELGGREGTYHVLPTARGVILMRGMGAAAVDRIRLAGEIGNPGAVCDVFMMLSQLAWRGQLVLSGARGEFVYLRGDRHDAASLLPFLVVG